MKKKDLERILFESESVREAVEHGVPLEDVVELYLDVNKLVEEGKWVQLHVRKPTHAEKIKQGTSLIRYWGPEEFLEGKKYITASKAHSLYEKGLIGKTHELVRGSEYYSKEEDERPSIPSSGSRVYHRHWEIEEMYKYRGKGKYKKLFIIILGILFANGILFILSKSLKITGFSILEPNAVINILTIGILSILVVVILFSRFRIKFNF